MSRDAEIVKAVCKLLHGTPLKARELVRKLGEAGISIEKQELNSTLYREIATVTGLSVDDAGVWSLEILTTPNVPPSNRASAQSIISSGRSNADPLLRTRSYEFRPENARGTHAADGGHPPIPDSVPLQPFVISPEQRLIIEAVPSQWTLVEAGPGTGKTAVALARVAHLINAGVSPSTILMVSFTRTAIAELRQRIEAQTKDVGAVAAVRVTTLDSEAWHLGAGFGEGVAAAKLTRGFDRNIEDAIALFDKDDPALCEWMSQTRHLILDEAQDLVGRRAELVFQILDHLPDMCGVTVFVDPAQAIFGFAAEEGEEDDDPATAPTLPFHKKLLKNFPNVFTSRPLTRLYRSSNPQLQKVFEQGRTLVLSASPPGQRFADLRQLARDLCAPSSKVEERPDFAPDELILFRRRSEVLLASSLLANKGIPHRIRMARTSLGLQPWLAAVLGAEPANRVTRDDFARRWDQATPSSHLRGLDSGRAWTAVRSLAGTTDGTAVDVRVLRGLLARSRPPVELIQTEVGMMGPIVGTIHASKGREANKVSLMLPPERAGATARTSDAEVRVEYVGTTRARTELAVGTGYSGRGYKSLEGSGRVYRAIHDKHRGPGQVQVELGGPADVDELSVVAKALVTAAEARQAQAFLAGCTGQVVPLLATAGDDFRYRLCTEDGVGLGLLAAAVNNDLFAIAKVIDSRTPRRPPSKIPHITLIGVRAYALDDDHPGLAELHEPWATTGIFLVPVIRALAKTLLPPYGQRGNR